ncbi:hypothetical protein HN615_02595 [Candidatus Woesearchaeota archaeon]|nr:hypothetical protein [Candidatus Woesearchaeota archaeon]
MKKIAMIPVMFDSTRVPKKNLILLNGQTMTHYVVKTCIESNVFDEIYINSESLIAKEIADELGVNFFYRNPEHGGSKCTMENVSVKCNGNRCQTHDHFVYDFIQNIEADILFQVHTTTPLIKVDTIKNFVYYFEKNEFHSLFTAISEQKETVFRESPVNFSYKKKNPTQTLEKVLKMTSGMAAWDVNLYKKRYQEYSNKKNTPSFGDSTGWFEIPFIEGIDVDNWDDLEIVNSILYYRNQKMKSEKICYYHNF